jgi:hypothetical protein
MYVFGVILLAALLGLLLLGFYMYHYIKSSLENRAELKALGLLD